MLDEMQRKDARGEVGKHRGAPTVDARLRQCGAALLHLPKMEVATPDPLLCFWTMASSPFGLRLSRKAHCQFRRHSPQYRRVTVKSVNFHHQLDQRLKPSNRTRLSSSGIRSVNPSSAPPFLLPLFSFPTGGPSFPQNTPPPPVGTVSFVHFLTRTQTIPARCKKSRHSPGDIGRAQVASSVKYQPEVSESTCAGSDTTTGTGFHQSPCDQASRDEISQPRTRFTPYRCGSVGRLSGSDALLSGLTHQSTSQCTCSHTMHAHAHTPGRVPGPVHWRLRLPMRTSGLVNFFTALTLPLQQLRHLSAGLAANVNLYASTS